MWNWKFTFRSAPALMGNGPPLSTTPVVPQGLEKRTTKETDNLSPVVLLKVASSFASLPRCAVPGDLNATARPPVLTVKFVVAVLLFPAASVAVIVIVYVPIPTIVPASGLWLSVTGPQLSLAMVPARTFGIAAWPLNPALALVGAGAVRDGAVVSTTVTVWVA